jgi:hypothetical protein
MAGKHEEHASTLDVLAVGIVLGLLYVWFRAAFKAAEAVVPVALRVVRPSIGSVIARAEAITREAVETAGKEGSS